MYVFKGYPDPHHARFENPDNRDDALILTKQGTIDRNDDLKRKCGSKGYSPDSEQTKFALDRWPGTALHRGIYGAQKK